MTSTRYVPGALHHLCLSAERRSSWQCEAGGLVLTPCSCCGPRVAFFPLKLVACYPLCLIKCLTNKQQAQWTVALPRDCAPSPPSLRVVRHSRADPPSPHTSTLIAACTMRRAPRNPTRPSLIPLAAFGMAGGARSFPCRTGSAAEPPGQLSPQNTSGRPGGPADFPAGGLPPRQDFDGSRHGYSPNMGTLDPYSAAATVHGGPAVYRTGSDSYRSRSNCRIGETGRLGSRDPPDLAGDTGRSSAAAEAAPELSGDSDEELDEERPRRRRRRRRTRPISVRDQHKKKKARSNATTAADDGKDGGRFKADVRVFLIQEWMAYVRKRLGREGVNLRLSTKNAATYIQKGTVNKTGIPHKLSAIKGVLDQVRKYMQARQDASPTGSGTSDVEEVQSRIDDEKAKAWRMNDDEMSELVDMGKYLLSMTGRTKKTVVVTLWSVPDPNNSDTTSQVDDSSATNSGLTTSASDDCNGEGELPRRVRARLPPYARRGLGDSRTPSAAHPSPATPSAAQPPPGGDPTARSPPSSSTGPAIPAPVSASRLRAASGRSSRASTQGGGDCGGDPFLQQLVSLVDKSPGPEREEKSVAVLAVQMQADAAERRDAASAADAAKKAEAAARVDTATAAEAARRHEKDVLRLQLGLEKQRNAVVVEQLRVCSALYKETQDPAVLAVLKGVGVKAPSVRISAVRSSAGTSGAACREGEAVDNGGEGASVEGGVVSGERAAASGNRDTTSGDG